MISASERNHKLLAWLLILLGVFLRLLLAQGFLLAPEEVNVWRFSRDLLAGYPEHPPLLLWAIHFATRIFGNSEIAVRLPTILGLGVAGLYLNLLSARWGSWRCAFHLQLLLQGLLLSNGHALIATPDGLLLPCWAGATYHATMSMEQRRTDLISWLFTGFWFGLGVLCKFTMILFLPALVLSLLWNRCLSITLRQTAPWLGLALSLTLLLPLFFWNMAHNWQTWHHFIENLHLSLQFSWRSALDFLAAQAALLSPVLLPLIWLSWGTALGSFSTRERRLNSLTWLSLFPFSIIFLLSFGSRGHSTWSAPAYLSALVLTALLFAPKPGGRISWIWAASHVTAWSISVLVLLQTFTFLLPVPVPLDRTAREIIGWKELAKAVQHEVNETSQPDTTFVFSTERYLADELAFYLPGQPDTAFFHPWRIPPDESHRARGAGQPGASAIGVLTDDRIPMRLRHMFLRVDTPKPFEIRRISLMGRNELVTTFYLVRAEVFKGESAP